MADLVKHRALQEVGSRDPPALDVRPLDLLPRQPVADLGVGGEQDDRPARFLGPELERQHEAGVIGVLVELQAERGRRVQPVVVDAAPGLRGVDARAAVDDAVRPLGFLEEADGLRFPRAG